MVGGVTVKKADRERLKAEEFIAKAKEATRCEFVGERAIDGMWGMDYRCVLTKGHKGLCRWKN